MTDILEKPAKVKQKAPSGGSFWNSFRSKNADFWSNILKLLQRLGKSLMFPIAVLPFAAILNRFGQLGIDINGLRGFGEGTIGWWVGKIVQTPGAVVFDNLPLFFAIGCGFGLAKDNRGEAALVGALAYIIITALLGQGMLPDMFYKNQMAKDWTLLNTNKSGNLEPSIQKGSELFYLVKTSYAGSKRTDTLIYILNIGVLGGIVAGCLAAYFYNHFKDIKLPQALSFFGGRRFVPMLVGIIMVPVAFLFAAIWPWIQYGLAKFGQAISKDGWSIGGAFFYGVINRLLQPFGLHHILNTFLWFQLPVEGVKVGIDGSFNPALGTEVVAGDINAFQKGISTSGNFQALFFPMFLGGLPAAALAMIMAADKQKRRQVAAFLGGVGIVAFLTGIDEPLAFSFIFVSPLLWGIHALFTGILGAATIALKIRVGFGFSAGFIDYVISFAQSWGMAMYKGNTISSVWKWLSNPLMIFPLAAVAFPAYYFVFLITIKKTNIATPGRETDGVDSEVVATSRITGKGKDYDAMAQSIIEAVGKENFEIIENCATRLRLTVVDNQTNVDDKKIKEAGAYAIKRLGKQGLQIVIGTDVEHVTNKIKEKLDKF